MMIPICLKRPLRSMREVSSKTRKVLASQALDPARPPAPSLCALCCGCLTPGSSVSTSFPQSPRTAVFPRTLLCSDRTFCFQGLADQSSVAPNSSGCKSLGACAAFSGHCFPKAGFLGWGVYRVLIFSCISGYGFSKDVILTSGLRVGVLFLCLLASRTGPPFLIS